MLFASSLVSESFVVNIISTGYINVELGRKVIIFIVRNGLL